MSLHRWWFNEQAMTFHGFLLDCPQVPDGTHAAFRAVRVDWGTMRFLTEKAGWVSLGMSENQHERAGEQIPW